MRTMSHSKPDPSSPFRPTRRVLENGVPLNIAVPPVVRLPVHLEGMQNCRYEEGAETATVDAGAPPTELTAWFDYIKTHADSREPTAAQPMTDTSPGKPAWSAKYPDFPERFRFDEKKKVWKPRKQLHAFGYVGRVYHVPHSAGELFYLRLLLHRIPGDALALLDVTNDAVRQRDRYTLDAFLYHQGVRHDTFKACCEPVSISTTSVHDFFWQFSF